MKLTYKATLGLPAMYQVFRGHDTQAFQVASQLVNRFVDSFQFAQKMTPAVKEVFVADALECFQHESLQDMILFFKNARKGVYGSAKKGIDANLVFGEWFPQYLELKAKERERVLQEKKESVSFTTSIDQVKATYQAARDRKELKEKHQKMTDEIDKMVEPFDRAMLEDTIADWEQKPELKEELRYLKKKRRIIRK